MVLCLGRDRDSWTLQGTSTRSIRLYVQRNIRLTLPEKNTSLKIMNPKEAKILAYALQFILANWDDDMEEDLDGLACEKDVQFLLRKYEGLSQTYDPNQE
jgi:hypothetical protein